MAAKMAKKQTKWRQHRFKLAFAAVLICLVTYLMVRFIPERPVTYSSELDHFKYGSIGSEGSSGIPYWIFQAIPLLDESRPANDYWQRFGFVYEAGQELPIGFSQRTVQGIKRVWLNCASCHTGSITSDGSTQIIIGAPANTLRLYDFIQFMRQVGLDNRFEANKMMAVIDQLNPDMDWIERLLYRYLVIDSARSGLQGLREQLAFLDWQHNWGPGRVDTFNPYKAIQFNFPMAQLPQAEINAATDYPSIWMQRPREGMNLHWDGNNASLQERNLSAALGAGVTPVTVDHKAIERVAKWLLDFPAPKFPGTVDQALVETGRGLYQQYCTECHGYQSDVGYIYHNDGIKTGEVEPLAEIGTDPHRWLSYSEALAANQNSLYAGTPYRFTHFKRTTGYANQPLDGIWARSPYLHNGSVPTLRDLLEPAANRPQQFYRGITDFDFNRVGYLSQPEVGQPVMGEAWLYDTRLAGNSNHGHEGPRYGTLLTPQEKDALVEYMKTF